MVNIYSSTVTLDEAQKEFFEHHPILPFSFLPPLPSPILADRPRLPWKSFKTEFPNFLKN